MAKSIKEKFDANHLRKLLVGELKQKSIPARVEIERIPSTKLHRILVLSKNFSKIPISDRQDMVWQIITNKTTPDVQRYISSILTLMPHHTSRTKSVPRKNMN